MDEEIKLDKAAFKALASDTRVSVLKQLAQRRKTLTELSAALGLAPSTLKEHLDALRAADLIVLRDDGHKWKYYELTRKGRAVLNPAERKVLILLAVSLLAAVAFGVQLPTDAGTALPFAESLPAAPEASAKAPAELALPAAAGAADASLSQAAPAAAPPLALFGLAASLVIALSAGSVLILQRAKPRA